MKTVILKRGQSPKSVKNLGWLLRNWKQVEKLGFNYAPDLKTMIDGELVAYLKDGGVFISDYSSLEVCWSFLDRPVFRGLEFKLVYGEQMGSQKSFIVGDTRWREARPWSWQF